MNFGEWWVLMYIDTIITLVKYAGAAMGVSCEDTVNTWEDTVNTRHLINVVLMLAHRLRRYPSI